MSFNVRLWFIGDKRYIDWDVIAENYDAIHFGHDAVISCRFIFDKKFSDGNDMFTASDLYSYDCECWVICRLDAIDFDTVREVTVNNKGELIMNKKYPSMNHISIKETLDFYKSLDPDKCYGDYIHFGDGKKLLKENATVDEYIQYLTEYDNKPTRKQFDRIITSIRNLSCASSSTVELCNLLLGNRKYYDKCIMVNDGSYRSNRIWFNPHCGQLDASVSLFEYDVRLSYEMTPKETVRWMFDHFDTIWLQCNCGDTVEDLEMNMNQTKLNDSINDYYDDQIWSVTDDDVFEPKGALHE